MFRLYPNATAQSVITFANWMWFAVPPMVICLGICWILLQVLFLRGVHKSGERQTDVSAILRAKYEALGAVR